jgi:photosystem II stability/assembly factor-like uncharacterized protein
MKSLHRLLCLLKTVLVPLMVALIVIPAVAQSTGEWKATWKAGTSNGAYNADDSPRELVSTGPGNYTFITSRQILHTTDAGITWTPLLDNGGNFNIDFTNLASPTSQQLIVLADSTGYEGTTYFRYGIIHISSNGGSTWMEHRFDGKRWLRDVSMADANTGLVAMQIPVAGAADSLLLTTDGGNRWQGYTLPQGVRYPDKVYCLSSDSWGLVAYDTTEKGYHFYRTTDRGAKWSRATNIPEGWGTIRFVNESLAWTAGGLNAGLGDTRRDMIARSTDGGITWTTMLDTLLDFRFGLSDIAFADENNGIAVGGYGKIYRTTDGGETWHQEWPPTELVTEYINVRQVAYPAVDEAIAIGGFDAIAYRGVMTLAPPTIVLPNTNLADHPIQTTITWSPIEGATSYDLQIGDTAYDYNFVAHRMFDVPYLERTGLTDTSLEVTLQPHMRYAVRVRARNATQTSDWSVRLNMLTLGEGKTLSSPVFTSPKNGAQQLPLEVTLTWSPVPTAIGYDLRVSLEPTFIITHVDEENVQDTTYLLTNLQPNTTYYARIRARDVDGVVSAWSNLASGPLVFITGSVASVGGGTGIETVMSLRPNITADHAELRLDLSRDEDVEVRLVDMQGNQLTTHSSQRLTAGTHLVPLDVSVLPGGSYFVVVTMHGVQRQLPLTVAR